MAAAMALAMHHGASSASAVDKQQSRCAIHWPADKRDASRTIVEVSGISPATLDELRRVSWSQAQWQKVLSVHAEQGDLFADIGLPPMLGTYSITPDALRFEPQFPLTAAVSYAATFDPTALPGAPQGRAVVSSVHQMTRRASAPSSVVTQIYPTAP